VTKTIKRDEPCDVIVDGATTQNEPMKVRWLMSSNASNSNTASKLQLGSYCNTSSLNDTDTTCNTHEQKHIWLHKNKKASCC